MQKATGCTPQEINKTLIVYKEVEKLYDWIRKRAKAGKSLPANQNEMMKMMMESDGGMVKKINMRR